MIELTTLEHTQIIFLIINVISSHILSLYMIHRSRTKQVKELLYVGSSFLSSAVFNYYPFLLSYILILFIGNPINILVIYIMFPISFIWIILWVMAYTKLLHQKKRKTILAIVGAFVLVFQVHYWTILILSPNSIGELVRGYYMSWAGFISIYLLGSMVILMISGFDFSYHAIKTGDTKTKSKGKLIMVALIFTLLGVLFESIFTLHGYLFIIPRTLHIISGFFFYFGFVLPKFLQKRLL